jgi:hypothetical protein
MYTISFHENGKPFTLPGIPNPTVLTYLIKVLIKGAIEGTFNISHLTTIKHS